MRIAFSKIYIVTETANLMNSYGSPQNILFLMCYGGMTLWSFMCSLYLLLRRNNAFATDVTPSPRLRRWMAATCASVAASHIWWMLFYYSQADGSDPTSRILLCRVLDILLNWSTTFYTMLVMLQDRRRPLWLAFVFVVLALTGLLMDYFYGNQMPWVAMLLAIVTFLYVVTTLVRSVKQYGSWLRENYADLEHKEVWQTYLVMFAFLPTIFFYSFFNVNIAFDIMLESSNVLLMFILLWRVETLQGLEELVADSSAEAIDGSASDHLFSKIELMLQQNCIETQYYLHHDVSLTHLAKRIGTNNTYLSRYFAHKGITYHTYINTLRIEHFMRLYQTTIKTRQFVTAAELAYESGYKSYSTFSVAFKQINGLPVSSWMKQQEGQSI